MKIDAIGQWAGESLTVPLEIGHRTAARPVIASGVAAWAWITRRDESEARREPQRASGAGDHHTAIFERLP
jgi:heme A synthase